MSKWTPEPWKTNQHPPEVKMGGHPQDWQVTGQDPDGKFGTCQHVACFRLEVDARRADACVNALAGLNPEAVRRLVKVAEKVAVSLGETWGGIELRTALNAVRKEPK